VPLMEVPRVKDVIFKNLLQVTTLIVHFNGSEKLNNLVGADTSVDDEIYNNGKQLYWHRQDV